MKLKVLLAGVIAGVLVAVSSTVFAAQIMNGGFEAGLSSWAASSTSPQGFVDVVTACPTFGTPSCSGAFAPYQPVEGSRFALLWSRGPILSIVASNGVPVPTTGTMTLASNGVQVAAGALLTGRVFFNDGQQAGLQPDQVALRSNSIDFSAFCDTATVRVFFNSSPVTLFSANSCATSGDDSTQWLTFQYLARTAGTLSVEARLVNSFFPEPGFTVNQRNGSDIFRENGSAMGLDAVQVVEPAPQPRVGALPLGSHGTRDNLARQAAADAAAQQAANAVVVAIAQPATGALRPPNTGDAGLLAQDSDNNRIMLILMSVLGFSILGGAGRLRWKSRRQR